MKRLGAILSVALILVMMTASFCFADSFELVSTNPKDGDTNRSIDNFSIKLQFNQPVLNEANEAANARCVTVRDQEGNRIPVELYYSPKEEGLVMALFNKNSNSEISIQEDTEYTVTVSEHFLNAEGDELGQTQTITFKTLNQTRSTRVYMLIMVVMFGGMFFFSNKAMKKEEEKKKDDDKVNPYKVAKETGKSVEEIVAKEQKKKAKKSAADARRTPKNGVHEEEKQDVRNPDAKRVKGPRPISAGGSTYITGRKAKAEAAAQAARQKGTTNPKKKSGKKNKK